MSKLGQTILLRTFSECCMTTLWSKTYATSFLAGFTSVIHNPSTWTDLCQCTMAHTTTSQQVADAATSQNACDDEGESLNASLSQESKTDDRRRLTLRWHTQLFALECCHDICTVMASSGQVELTPLRLKIKAVLPPDPCSLEELILLRWHSQCLQPMLLKFVWRVL